MYPLGYEDGILDNFSMREVSKSITAIIQSILDSASEEIAVEFITLDLIFKSATIKVLNSTSWAISHEVILESPLRELIFRV